MSAARIMRLVTGAAEAFLGIPIIGALFIISQGYVPLLVMFILHLITYILSRNNRSTTAGSILGMITSLIAWIPFVGITMHIISAITLLITGALSERKTV